MFHSPFPLLFPSSSSSYPFPLLLLLLLFLLSPPPPPPSLPSSSSPPPILSKKTLAQLFIFHFSIWCHIELHISDAGGDPVLPLPPCAPQRLEASEPPDQCPWSHQTGRLWTGQGFWGSCQNIHTRGKDEVLTMLDRERSNSWTSFQLSLHLRW